MDMTNYRMKRRSKTRTTMMKMIMTEIMNTVWGM